MQGMNASGAESSFDLRIRWSVCANGETYEFWLEQDGRRLMRENGESLQVFVTLEEGERPEHMMASALGRLLIQAEVPS